MPTEDFLEQLYKIEDTDQAIDHIFEYIDDLFWAGKFDECDEILSTVDFDQIDPTLLISFLCITLAAKSKLITRELFFQRVEEHYIPFRGKEETEKLMAGLK